MRQVFERTVLAPMDLELLQTLIPVIKLFKISAILENIDRNLPKCDNKVLYQLILVHGGKQWCIIDHLE